MQVKDLDSGLLDFPSERDGAEILLCWRVGEPEVAWCGLTETEAKQQSRDWLDRQRSKVDRGITELASELGDKPWCNGEAYSLADIATGCTLGYLDLRHPAILWRSDHENLVALFDKLSKRPSYSDSAPPKP